MLDSHYRTRKHALTSSCGLVFFSFLLFFTQEWTPHILRFDFFFQYTVIIPAAPQETVEEDGIEPGTAALQSGPPSRALANWATTSSKSHHIPHSCGLVIYCVYGLHTHGRHAENCPQPLMCQLSGGSTWVRKGEHCKKGEIKKICGKTVVKERKKSWKWRDKRRENAEGNAWESIKEKEWGKKSTNVN
jgi:hypothetical protein